jgi:ribonuclease E
MSEQPGWAGFAAEHHAEESPAEMAVRLARQAAERDDRRAAREEAERRAAAEDAHDQRLFRFRQLGIGRTVAGMTADASRAAAEEDEEQEARAVIERAERRRASRARAAAFEAGQLAAVSRAAGSGDLLAPARAAHAEYVRASRAAWQAAQAGAPRRARRPFAGGAAVRSDQPVTCPHCRQAGATPEESFLIHQDPAPARAPAVPGEAERDWLSDREASAERRSPAGGHGLAVR